MRPTVASATGGARPLAGAKRRTTYEARDCAAPCLVALNERLPGGGQPRVKFTRAGRTYSGSARTRLRCAGRSRRARA